MKKLQHDDDSGIDPVAPHLQTEQSDGYFSQMGDNRNTKFLEQRVDDDAPIGSINGEYSHDDENADLNPPAEADLREELDKTVT